MRYVQAMVLAVVLMGCGASQDVKRPEPTAYCYEVSATVRGEQLYAEVCTEHEGVCVALSTGARALALATSAKGFGANMAVSSCEARRE